MFKIDDAQAAEAFTKLIASGSFTLTGSQIIEAYKSFAWFNKICGMIEEDLKNHGKKPEPKPDGRARRARSSSRSSHSIDQPERNKSGSEPPSE